jgi:hypothetical protein
MKHVLEDNRNPRKNAKEITYVIDGNGCHVCTSHKPNPKGYPHICVGGKYTTMARYVWALRRKRKPEPGEFILHKCGNRTCINVDHLFRGGYEDLIKIKVAEKRTVRYTDLTEDDIYAIKINTADTSVELAKKYKVSDSTIRNIWNEQVFAYIKVKGYGAICRKRKDRVRKSRAHQLKTAKGRTKK